MVYPIRTVFIGISCEEDGLAAVIALPTGVGEEGQVRARGQQRRQKEGGDLLIKMIHVIQDQFFRASELDLIHQ